MRWVSSPAAIEGSKRRPSLATKVAAPWVTLAMCLTLLWCFPRMSSAQSKQYTLRGQVELSDKPDRGYVAVAQLGNVVSVTPAVLVENEKERMVEVIGQVLVPSHESDCVALFLVVGKSGAVSSRVMDISLSGEAALAAAPREVLRTQLHERAIELRRRENEVKDQKQTIKKLQSDTNPVGAVESLAAAEEALERLQEDVSRLNGVLHSLSQRLINVQELPVPAMARRRGAELATELNAISVAVKSTETESLKRVSHASQELQDRVQLIESTKNEHIDLLQNELRSLIREREVLESGAR